jgi:cytochrome bd ubiquinol oxidase subunit II
MIGSLDLSTLQKLWWLICSLVGALFVFMNFVQGGQTLLWQVARTSTEKSLVINSLGRKWELAFTTLVMFGGALFAAFPKFYATSFGGAYWVWMLILFTFILQAVSYEFRTKPRNLLGARGYEFFLLINGSLGVLLIGAAVGTFYTGADFQLSQYNLVTWQHGLRGLEAAFNLFNVSMGLFLVFNARTLGAMYLLGSIDPAAAPQMQPRLLKAVRHSFLISLVPLVFVLVRLLTMPGFAVDEAGVVTIEQQKYLLNLLAQPVLAIMLVLGLALVVIGVLRAMRGGRGLWFSGPGTVLAALVLFILPAINGTAFYPSTHDPQSSLTIHNASSSHYTLTVMSYVALGIPLVLGYIVYVWRLMDRRKISAGDITDKTAY